MKPTLALAAAGACLTFAVASAEESQQPGVAVIIIDGLRPDILKEVETPTLDRLALQGAFADDGVAVFPTITRVNFISFSTGARVDGHGIVGAQYMDENWQKQRTDTPSDREAQKNVPIPTMFEVLEAEGFRTGIFAMKGYELIGARGASVQVGGPELFPEELWKNRYAREVNGSREQAARDKIRMNEVLLDAVEAALEREPLDLLLLNFGAVDYIGHSFGPDESEYREAIRASDTQVARLIEILQAAQPDRPWVFIIGADHGFSQTNPEQLVPADTEDLTVIPKLNHAEIEHRFFERGGRAGEVYLRDPEHFAEAFALLQELPWVKRIYTDHPVGERDGTMQELRVNFPGRSGDFYVISDTDYAMHYAGPGQHGSNDEVDLLVPVWVVAPERVSPGTRLTDVGNVDFAPTVLDLFGFDPAEHLQADGRTLLAPTTDETPDPVAAEEALTP